MTRLNVLPGKRLELARPWIKEERLLLPRRAAQARFVRQQAQPDMTDPNPEIASRYGAWQRAFRAGDVPGVLALLTDDYLLFAPGRPPMGREALRPQLQAAFNTYDIRSHFECEERLIGGDLVVDRGWDCQTLHPHTGGASTTQRQRVVLVLRRSPDGQWRFARGMSQPGPAV